MKMWSAPHCMKSIPLGRHVLYKEIKRDVRQRPFATAGLEPDEATVSRSRHLTASTACDHAEIKRP